MATFTLDQVHSEFGSTEVPAPAGGLKAWAGDIVLSSANTLEDGRVLLPCDSSYDADGTYPDLDSLLSGTPVVITFTETSSHGSISDGGLYWQSSVNGGGYFHTDLLPSSGKYSIELEPTGSTQYSEFTIYFTTNATTTGPQDNYGGIRMRAKTLVYTGSIGTAFTGAFGTQVSTALDANAGVGSFEIDADAGTLEYKVNGVSMGVATGIDFSNIYLLAYHRTGGYNGNLRMVINGSKNDTYSYEYESPTATPNYTATGLPYKIVAQNPA